MDKFKTSVLALAATALPALAAVMPQPGAISTSGDTMMIGTPAGTVTVKPITSEIFKVSRVPRNVKNFSFPKSQSSVLDGDLGAASWYASPSTVTFITPSLRLDVDRQTGRSVFLNAQGDTLLVEAAGVDNSADLKTITFANGRAQNFYGAGERGHSLRLNGDTLVMYNRQNYGYTAGDPRISQMGITMPWFLSDAGYGVLVDDYNKARLVLGDDLISYSSDTPKPLSYYFVGGDGSIPSVTSGFTNLTGRQSLPPFWALGYITSRYGYHNEQEALGAVDSLKQRGFPVDGIVFDLYWYGKETDMGRLEWNPDQFPDHRRMLDSLRNQGVNTVLITQPYINKIGAIDNYNELAAAGMLTRDEQGNPHDVTTWVGEAGMFDISNPETREWLWNRLRPLTEEGLAGWWGDLGEPEVHPATIRHANGETAEQFHNVYGNEWSRLIYDGLRKDFPEMRPLLMMRGGTAGLQRYSVFPWTTDVSRSWGGLQPQIPLMLNSGLSGLGYMSSDIGGFAVDPEHPYDPELYVRWLQMGVFSPVLRTHAQDRPEPYHYPAQQDIVKRFIKMRYEWLPYNYTLAYENAAFGLPLARPVNFHSEAGTVDANSVDEYLWGPDVLVAPVLTAGARTRKVEFPAGSSWYDWANTARTFKGGTSASVAAPLESLPLFVREGAFIPQYTRPIENVTQYDQAHLQMKYFMSGEPSDYTLFDDNRVDPETLEKGCYTLTRFEASREAGATTISIRREGAYPGMPAMRQIEFEVIGGQKPTSIAIDGELLPASAWSYNAASRTLSFPLRLASEAKIVIR